MSKFYNIVPIVNNMMLGTLNFVKKVDLTLSILTLNQAHKKSKETLRGVGYIYSLECGDSNMGISYIQNHQII